MFFVGLDGVSLVGVGVSFVSFGASGVGIEAVGDVSVVGVKYVIDVFGNYIIARTLKF